jgi:hypothetical protein
MLFSLANLSYWLLLGLGILLFLLVIASGGGEQEFDAEAEVEITQDFPEQDADANGELSFGQILGWLGLGKAPLILLLAIDLSLWGLGGWMLNVGVGTLLGTTPSGLLANGILVSSLITALYLGSWIARPLGRVFATFGEDASDDRLVGCEGTVSSALIPYYKDGRIGQVNVVDPARNLVTVNAALPAWATVRPRLGDAVLVIERLEQTYLVIARDSVDQNTWLNQPSRSFDSR